MTSALLIVFGLCFVYQAYRFRRAGMPRFALAYAISVALMLAGFAFHWPDAVRLATTVLALALLLTGAYQLRKHPGAETPNS